MASPEEPRASTPRREPVVYHTDQGDITVQEFRPEDGDFIASAAGEGNWVSFGGGPLRPEVVYNELIRAARSRHDGSLFLLSWEGNKVPRGVQIHGQEIGWTQHGRVTSVEGKNLGHYDRLIEWGGESGRQHQMLIFANKPRPQAPGRPHQ